MLTAINLFLDNRKDAEKYLKKYTRSSEIDYRNYFINFTKNKDL